MKKALIELVAILAIALLISYAGGLTRPYTAFGGEDMLALTVVGYGIYRMIERVKEVLGHE